MRHRTLAAVGLALALGVGLAGPAVAGTGTGAGTCDGTGISAGRGPAAGTGSGTGQGPFGRSGRRAGTGIGTGTVALTTTQKADLVAMAEEEKLAGDLYAAFAAAYGDSELTAIAASEDRHLAALQQMMRAASVVDPTQGMPAGAFRTASVQRLYDALLARGSDGLAAAYAVGVSVEKQDIADLDAALSRVTAAPVVRVYTNLRAGSVHHLAAFSA